jgi:LacI family transcriptional regulator
MKNIRLEDIAKRLNLSKVSISKALRDHPDISIKTRKKIKKAAKEMGYHPNQVARSLASKKTRIIGVIVPKIAHFFFSYVIEGIYNAVIENDYDVILGVSLENGELEDKHLESFLQMRVDGLLVSISQETKNPAKFEAAKEMGIKLVFFDRVFEDAGFSCVKVEDRVSAKNGVKYMIDSGYRNIAHLGGFDDIDIGKERERGYKDALIEAGIDVDESAIIRGGFGEQDGYDSFKKLLKSYGKPEALFSVTYPAGLGALRYMNEHNMNPKEISILTFGASDFNQYLPKQFICIEQPTIEVGQIAFEQLLSEIESKGKVLPRIIKLPAHVRRQ